MIPVMYSETTIKFDTIGNLSKELLDRLYRNYTLSGGMREGSQMKEIISFERCRRLGRYKDPNWDSSSYANLPVAILRHKNGTIIGWAICNELISRKIRSARIQVFIQQRFRKQKHGGRLVYLFSRKINKYYPNIKSFAVYGSNIYNSLKSYINKFARNNHLSFTNLYY